MADREKAILKANINRWELDCRAKLTAMIVILAVLFPQSGVHLTKKSAASNAAFAADATSQATTMPASGEGQLPPLPARFSSKRVALQVLSPAGETMPIDSIQYIYVWIPEGKWMDGPTPEVLARYAKGWVLVNKEMFALAKTGQRVDLIFSSGGSALQVSAKYPSGSPKKITFDALFDANEIGVDTSAGPVAAKDELAGQVVDPNGKGVAGAVVSFPPDSFEAMMHKPFTTGKEGVFRFSGLDERRYIHLNVEKSGYAKRILVNVPVGRGFLVHMDDSTRIKGQFLGSDGLPASNAKIDFVTSKASGRADMIDMIPDLTVSAAADSQGRYDLPLEPGEYEIRVTASNGFGRFPNVEVPSGQIVGISEKLESGADLKIVAIDTLTNKPASGVTFFIWDHGGEFVMSERKDSERTTGANGEARWANLMPGNVEIDARSEVYAQWWTDEMKGQGMGRFIDALEINVSQGMAPVTVHLEPGVHVTGTVVSPDGKPVSGAEVNIGGLRTGDARYANRTDVKGSFSLNFPVLNSGNDNQASQYAIVANDPRHQWANAAGDWFTPTAGQTFSLTLKMTAGACLRGRVVGKDGKPIADVQVRAQADDRLDCTYYDPRAVSDDHGRFELGPMRGVRYSIYFAGNFQDIWRLSVPPLFEIRVVDGDAVDVGVITYDGPAPFLSPWDKQEFRNRPPVPETDDAIWRQVTPVLVPATVQPPPAPAAQAQPLQQEADTSPLEEPLPGNPAPAGHLAGKVVDEGGRPLAGVVITVWARDHGDRTDVAGKFTFTSLPQDRAVEIRFAKDGYCPRFIPAQPSGLSGVVVVLTNKTYFEGQVKDSSRKPVAGAKVRGDQGRKQADRMMIPWVWTETSTDAQGSYRLYVQPDTYDIQVRLPGVGVARTGKLPIADGQARHLDINLAAGITFRAHVVDSITNQPVGGIRLWSGQNPGVEGRSDPSGNLVIPSMVPGAISFNVDAKGYARWWSDAAAKEWERQPDVRNGNFQWNFSDLEYDMTPGMPDTTIVVEREVTIRGKVIDPDGLPVTGATIGAVDTGSDRSISGDERFAVPSKAGGIFEMKLPASGDHGYNLIAHDGQRRAWRKWANGVLPIVRTKPGQELDDITIVLTRPAVVRGQVVDAHGNPVIGREVRAIGSDLLEDINYEASARTDQSGNFELKFVRPGSQMIQVAPFVYRALMAPEGTSKTFTLTEGEALDGVNLTAMPGDEDR